MYPVSNRFHAAVKQGHKVVSLVKVMSRSGQELAEIPVSDGYVTIDQENSIRRRAYFTLDDDGTYTPSQAGDLFHVLSNNQFWVYRGIEFNDGTRELVPQGRFDVNDVDDGDSGERILMRVEGYDYSRRISDRRLLHMYTVPAGTPYDTAIHNLIHSVHPGLTYSFAVVNAVTPRLVFGNPSEGGGGDPWKYATEMAESVAHELYFDGEGVCVLRPIPLLNDSTPVVWEYREGKEAIIMYINRRTSKDEVFNHVVVTGESSSNAAPVRGEAKDTDPTSPTYAGDPNATVNIALNKPVTAKGTEDPARPWARATDANFTGDNHTHSTTGADGWLQVDLGAVMLIDRVKVWHYYPDGRTYYSPRTEVSEDGANWTVVSKPAQYAETSAGHTRDFPLTKARYVRDYISGSTANIGNHWIEVEVYARESRFGDVPTFMQSEYVTTVAQAEAVAKARLRQTLGAVEGMNIVSVPHPAHEPGDAIKVVRERQKVDKKYIIKSLTMPLSAQAPLNITMQESRR